MTYAIPVINVADYLDGRLDALRAVARQMHDPLTTIGFPVATTHEVPQSLVARTFAEAALAADHLCRLAEMLVRRELRPAGAKGPGRVRRRT